MPQNNARGLERRSAQRAGGGGDEEHHNNRDAQQKHPDPGPRARAATRRGGRWEGGCTVVVGHTSQRSLMRAILINGVMKSLRYRRRFRPSEVLGSLPIPSHLRMADEKIKTLHPRFGIPRPRQPWLPTNLDRAHLPLHRN